MQSSNNMLFTLSRVFFLTNDEPKLLRGREYQDFGGYRGVKRFVGVGDEAPTTKKNIYNHGWKDI